MHSKLLLFFVCVLVCSASLGSACYSASCQGSYSACVSCRCSTGQPCGWTGGGCICARRSANASEDWKEQAGASVLFTDYNSNTCGVEGAQNQAVFRLDVCSQPLGTGGSVRIGRDPRYKNMIDVCAWSSSGCVGVSQCKQLQLETCYAYGNGEKVFYAIKYVLL